MKGTPKQIAWAEDIKTRVLAEAQEYLQRGRESAARAVAKGIKTQEECDKVLGRYEAALERLSKIDVAAWWIDKRRFSARELLQAVQEPGFKVRW